MNGLSCPSCGGSRIRRDGSILAARGGRVQRYRCVECGKKFHPSLRLQPVQLREAFLDIEASQLTASFGHVISWALKHRGQDEVLYDCIRHRSLREERRVLRSLLRALQDVDMVYTYYGCVAPEHRVLTADLRWVPVGELKEGDRLLTISEYPKPRRRWEVAEVQYARPFVASGYRVHLADGTSIVATPDHPWLVRHNAGNGGYKWTQTQHLLSGSQVRPARLLAKFDPTKLGALKHRRVEAEHVPVVALEPVASAEFIGLQTSSRTYIVEGFVSHNSRFDIPFLRTRCLYHGLDFPEYLQLYHRDVYYIARGRLRLHGSRLAQVAEFLGIEGKTPLDPNVWVRASFGDKEALRYILEHNIADVEVLEKVYDRLEPYARPVYRSV